MSALAFISMSTRRVSTSLYQRARYSSFVQGTLPANHELSHSPMDDISRESTKKGELPKQVEKKPKLTTLAKGGLKVDSPPFVSKYVRCFPLVPNGKAGEKILDAILKKKRAEFHKIKAEWESQVSKKRNRRDLDI